MNLVENDLLGRVIALAIWQSHCIITSAAAGYVFNESAKQKLPQLRQVPLIPHSRYLLLKLLRMYRAVVMHVRWPGGYFTDKYP